MNIITKDHRITISNDTIKLSKFLQELETEFSEIEILGFSGQEIIDFFDYLVTRRIRGLTLDQIMRMSLWFQTDQVDCIERIIGSKDIELFEKYKECICTNDSILSSTRFYDFISRYGIKIPYKYNFMENYRFTLNDGYEPDPRILKHLRSEKNFVQANDPQKQTMLYFFGPLDKIIDTVKKIMNDVESYKIYIDSIYQRLFIIPIDGSKVIACQLTFTESFETFKYDPFGVIEYFDGFHAYRNEKILSIQSITSLCFDDKTPILYSHGIDKWIGNLSRGQIFSDFRLNLPDPYNMYYSKGTIRFRKSIVQQNNGYLSDFRGIRIQIQDNQFVTNDMHISYYLSRLIVHMINKISYIIKYIEGHNVMNIESLYDSERRLDYDGYRVYAFMQFDITFDSVDRTIVFKESTVSLI